MGEIYTVPFCIKSVTFQWHFSISVTIAYISYHQTSLQTAGLFPIGG